ncbi:MAG: hypothetical protein K2X47_13650, partial [Bdellovibrionales bacterium]|nr:hypothetical protein [Bdellovibrionales bacterium]
MNTNRVLPNVAAVILMGTCLQLTLGCGHPSPEPTAAVQTDTIQQTGGVDGGGGDLPQSTVGQVTEA